MLINGRFGRLTRPTKEESIPEVRERVTRLREFGNSKVHYSLDFGFVEAWIGCGMSYEEAGTSEEEMERFRVHYEELTQAYYSVAVVTHIKDGHVRSIRRITIP